jgi:hypothetical protein
MKSLLLLLPLAFVLAVNCKDDATVSPAPDKEELILQSGFENDVRVVPRGNDADLVGADKRFAAHNDWVNDLDNHSNIGNFTLQFHQGGDSSTRSVSIIPEPGKPDNHVLRFWLSEPSPTQGNGRIQGNIYGNNDLKEIYQSERIFLHPDFNTVRTYPKDIHWLTIAEFWNNITWSQTVPYRFRITLGLGKPVATESDLYFILDAEDCELFPDDKQKYTKVWVETNQSVKVPIGQWFTMEYYYKEGDNNTGRFYMAITPEGGTKQVIFDVHKITHNTQDPAPDGLGDFNPIKLYTSKDLVQYMKSQGKTLQIYWDDLKLWKNKQPQ